MEKMKALVLEAPKTFSIQEVNIPEPKAGEVLVRIESVAICGSDPKTINGDYVDIGWPAYFPFTPGHEFAATVVKAGEGVTSLKPGDRVGGEAHCGCGVCENCKKGQYNLCLNYGNPAAGHRHYGYTVPGAYAQYNVYNTKALELLPDNVSFDEASMVDTAGTALQVIRLTGIVPGGYTVVIGPGPVGIIVMQMARAMGSKAIMIGRGGRLELAGKLGADYLIDYEKSSDPVKEVFEITGGMGADRSFECAGSDQAMAQCVYVLRKGGKTGFVSIPAVEMHPLPTKTMVMNQIAVIGSRANPNCSKEVLSLISSGKINVKDMITHTFELDDFGTALETFVKRIDGAMKVVIHPNA